MSYTDIFYGLLKRGFSHATAFALTAAHMAHEVGHSQETARFLLGGMLAGCEVRHR
jgi:hypothetical protein